MPDPQQGGQQVKFPFGRDFQVEIIALSLHKFDFLLTCVDLLKPEYFEDKVLVWFWQTIHRLYTQYRQQPQVAPQIENELRKAEQAGQIKAAEASEYWAVSARLNMKVVSVEYVVGEVVNFCRRQELRRAFLQSVPEMDNANDDTWDKIAARVFDAANVGQNTWNLGTNFFQEAQQRVYRRQNKEEKLCIPIGINEVDEKIGGGLKAGQLGIFMAGTGAGKSIALCWVGKRAIAGNYKVAHYTVELDEDDIADRYDALFTQTEISLLRTRLVSVADQMKWFTRKWGDHLLIKHYPNKTASVDTIRAHLKQLKSTGWEPDLVIVDYGDELKSISNYDSEYADLGHTFSSLRGLAGELKVPLWTATQTNRAGLNADIVDIEHIGDSLKKAQVADIVLALCSSKEDRKANILNLYLAKNRNGPAKESIPLRTNFAKMALHDPTRSLSAAGTSGQPQSPPPPTPLKTRRAPKAKAPAPSTAPSYAPATTPRRRPAKF